MLYKYVVAMTDNDYYKVAYNDVKKLDNAVFVSGVFHSRSKLVTWIYNHHFGRINNIVKIPFKSFWNKYYVKNDFDRSDNICFVLSTVYNQYIQYGFLDRLRKKYPKCKIVCFYQDMVGKVFNDMPIEKVKEAYDLVLAFDQNDCEKYGLTYYPLVYSCTEVENDESIPESDVYFVGKAKDRLDEILTAYERFRDAGLKCDFHITGVPESEQKYKDEIDYCTSVPYGENLKRIKKTRCMLEIMQGGGHGYTLRYCEAIAHDRRLITNNPEIKNAPFYNTECISVFDDVNSIDVDFIKNAKGFDVDYNFKEEISPIKMLEFIEQKL